MTVSRDKLGDFLLVSEAFNRYEEFAASGANFATVDEAAPNATGEGVIGLYRDTAASDERRLLIRSDRVYGSRRPVERFTFDLAFADVPPTDFVWEHSTTQQANGAEKHRYDAGVSLFVRAILTDFDPGTIAWDDAYGVGGLDFSDGELWVPIERASFTVKVDASAYIPPLGPTDPIVVRVKSADPYGAASDWSLCPEILSGVGDGWNAETEIFGFEVRIAPAVHFTTDGGPTPIGLAGAAQWLGAADSAICYAIRV